jgi:hypothetical protein
MRKLKDSIRFRVAMRVISTLALVATMAAQPMPRIEGESFAGQKVVLPDAARGKVAVLIFGFTKASKEPTSAWAGKIHSEFGTRSGFELYQLPVLESVPRFIRGMVISSIRKGVPEGMRAHFVPILQNEAELKKLVNYKETDDAYLVVLDPDGQVVLQRHGPFSEAAYGEFRTGLQALLERLK